MLSTIAGVHAIKEFIPDKIVGGVHPVNKPVEIFHFSHLAFLWVFKGVVFGHIVCS